MFESFPSNEKREKCSTKMIRLYPQLFLERDVNCPFQVLKRLYLNICVLFIAPVSTAQKQVQLVLFPRIDYIYTDVLCYNTCSTLKNPSYLNCYECQVYIIFCVFRQTKKKCSTEMETSLFPLKSKHILNLPSRNKL